MDTTEIAAIRHRQPQVTMDPAEAVEKWPGQRHLDTGGRCRTTPNFHGNWCALRHIGTSPPSSASGSTIMTRTESPASAPSPFGNMASPLASAIERS